LARWPWRDGQRFIGELILTILYTTSDRHAQAAARAIERCGTPGKLPGFIPQAPNDRRAA
jgi:hypothetical protein